MATSVKSPSRMPTTNRFDALRLQLVATEMSLRVGRRIRQRREELGIRTQRELADLIPSPSVTNQTVNKWEQGVNEPGPKYKMLLAEALQVDVAYFIAEDVTPNGNVGVRHLDTPELLRMLDPDNGIAGRLAELEQRVTAQLAEHAARVEQLLRDQDALLERQSQILERIELAFTGEIDEWVSLAREVVRGRPESQPERPRAARRTAAAKKS